MKRYSASELRRHLARAFDEVERGEPVIVERHGRRFRITAEPVTRPRARVKPFFEVTDASLLEYGWRWTWGGPGRPLSLKVLERRQRS